MLALTLAAFVASIAASYMLGWYAGERNVRRERHSKADWCVECQHCRALAFQYREPPPAFWEAIRAHRKDALKK